MEREDAHEELVLLSNKRALLSSPGLKMDSLYPSLLNSTVESVENTWNMGRLVVNLSQSSFGSTSLIVIPNDSFVDGIYLRLVLPPIAASGANSGVVLPRGWGLNAIQAIQFIWGSANTGALTVTKQAIFQWLMSEMETSEKMTEYLNQAGQEVLAPTVGTSTPNPTAMVFLPFPWTSACAHQRKGFDTTLLEGSSVITINITLDVAANIFGGPGVAAGTAPTQFSNAQVVVHQGQLAYRNLGLKPLMRENPDLVASYPFIWRQLFAPQIPQINNTANVIGTGGQPVAVSATLQSIINADLLAITFGVVNNANTSNTTGNVPMPFLYTPITDINLTFNGIVMYNTPDIGYQVVNMRNQVGSSYWNSTAISTGVGGFPPYTNTEIPTYMVLCNFSQLKSTCLPDTIPNVWRIPSNVLTLNFNIPPLPAGTTLPVTYNLYVTYHYTGMQETNSGGQVQIYFS